MTKELPARAHLEHLKSQAKDLLSAFKRGEPAALARFRTSLPAARGANDAKLVKMPLALHDAQSVLAREYGFASFGELKAEVERRTLSPEALRALMEKNKNEPLPEAVLEAMRRAALEERATIPGAPIAPGSVLPVVPVRNALVTVGSIAPLGIGRPTSVAAVRAAARGRGLLALFTQKDETNEAPTETDLHPVGSTAKIVSTLDVPGRGFWIVVRATAWITLGSIETTTPYVAARVHPFEIEASATEEVLEVDARLRELVKAFVATLPEAEALLRMTERMSPLELADATVANLPAPLDDKARYASEASLAARLRSALAMLEASQ
jgi:Lon protease-like protein